MTSGCHVHHRLRASVQHLSYSDWPASSPATNKLDSAAIAGSMVVMRQSFSAVSGNEREQSLSFANSSNGNACAHSKCLLSAPASLCQAISNKLTPQKHRRGPITAASTPLRG